MFVNYIATTTIPPGFCMFSEVSFRKGMVFYNFADFWTGFAFLVKTVVEQRGVPITALIMIRVFDHCTAGQLVEPSLDCFQSFFLS